MGLRLGTYIKLTEEANFAKMEPTIGSSWNKKFIMASFCLWRTSSEAGLKSQEAQEDS